MASNILGTYNTSESVIQVQYGLQPLRTGLRNLWPNK